MLKIEYIWRDLLFEAVEKQNPYFTITDLSKKFQLSTSVVSHAIIPLRELHMVEVGKLRSKVIGVERLLMFWATRRNITKEVLYKVHSSLPVFERESSMPSHVIPTAYSAYRFLYHTVPADYENIYFYGSEVEEIKKRFPENKKTPNVFILKIDPYLKKIYRTTPLIQIFVDLWTLPEWYAKDFSEALLDKIKAKIGL